MDFSLLAPLKRSRAYAGIRRLVADPKPTDGWQMDLLHCFVFALRRISEYDVVAYGLFMMCAEDRSLVSALLFKPGPQGQEPEVTDLPANRG